ncbi:MAG: LLM class flavin-dependent oxidoreductase [Leifsonia sp.]
MRFGIVILPQFEWPDAARYWVEAEQLGFDHAWTYDHLSWRSLAGERWHATVPTLTAAAMVTRTIRLGTFVASPNFRHPVPFAKDIATVDQISGGRVILGVGSGGTGFDANVLGQPTYLPKERFERFAEFVEALDLLLRHEEPGSTGIDVSGGWFIADSARMVGRPAQEPRMPFLVAAEGPRSLRLAARFGDGWVTTGRNADDTPAWWARIEELSRRLDDVLDEADRDPAGFDRCLLVDDESRYALASVGAFEDTVGRAKELGFTDVVTHWPRSSGIYAGDEAVLVEAASRMPLLR